MDPEEDEELKRTFREKLLFHVTAFFVLVGIFSLFAFLFLVPFVIDPALSTISAAFDPTPADCVTVFTEFRRGNSNCSWASCREGCTRDVYECLQVRVDYRRLRAPGEVIVYVEEEEDEEEEDEDAYERRKRRKRRAVGVDSWNQDDFMNTVLKRSPRAIQQELPSGNYVLEPHPYIFVNETETEEGDNSTMEYVYYSGARLYPNVKGCGYPPMLNCSIWHGKHAPIGATYPCHYSRIDPGLVISQLDMHAVYMDLVYAVLIPVPSFIISVVYLAFAYFKIYNEEEEETPGEDGAAGAEEGEERAEGESEAAVEGADGEADPVPAKTPTGSEGGGGDGEGGGAVEAGDVKGATEGGVANGVGNGVGNGVVGGGSLTGGKAGSPTSGEATKGNLTKTMTTSITPPHGPIAEV